MYAKVIVDVPAKQTNRAFDYFIPEKLREWVMVGSRVGVPFGPRKLQGFVVGLQDHVDYDPAKVKPIAEVMDLYPPLTPDLVELASWISNTYLCHEITALQAMIPGALKAKYERHVKISDTMAGKRNDEKHTIGQHSMLLPVQDEIISYVREKGSVEIETLLQKFAADGGSVKQLMLEGTLVEVQLIKDRMATKKILTVIPHEEPSQLLEWAEQLPGRSAKQKEVLQYFAERPYPIKLSELLNELSISASTVKGLADKGWLDIQEVEVFRDPYAERYFRRTEPLPLMPEQQQVFDRISQAVLDVRHQVFLLQGVTGSGKTEVYLQSIQTCLDQGREAIVLVPEISLTPQMVERFKGRFGNLVAVLHSRLSPGERYDEWRKIMLKQVSVVIGARSAIFAPFTRIGLIIIDEEHESSYKQEESPKYHARDVAVARAGQHQAVVVLGSATPSLESMYGTMRKNSDRALEQMSTATGNSYTAAAKSDSAARGSITAATTSQAAWSGTIQQQAAPFELLTMNNRVEGRPLPRVHIIDMREELREGNRSMFSRSLYKAIEERLHKKEQIVLLLNRRGYSTFVMCRTCGYVAQCPHCDISLTYHQSSRAIRCHYCGYAEREVTVCPSCTSEHIRHFGTGTQRVEEELSKLFPGIRVIRMDVDTTTEKGSHEKWLTMFGNRQADLLLGTQMVAKGLDFPHVTLVGALAADTVLNLPDFRAAERTFQLLTQVAGRAGRHELPGEVYVQTYAPEHYSIISASRHDYNSFKDKEMTLRKFHEYPPFHRLILITLSHEQIPLLMRTAEALAARLKELAQSLAPLPIEILGPVASPIARIKDRYRFQCMIKYRGEASISGLVQQAVASFEDVERQHKLTISIDVDPQVLM
ncbi:primosomal protein N' [Paenibacillus radicis (ex Xue et al. 2023)]|uniref:Replication restart protein PriA n=1 Tax=Paenibacillus radicis (ex Xue et al. 2023) TaxID=2972489 RepID=A0ABT1YKB1_9BACL|nr:primosomal protein N' [Paenibacillus radicis (ex Xue et al. 2023)]MCR8633624.1 primosomal protein N' [Paenibacillus radicis (ex Xue et al. 2023)]